MRVVSRSPRARVSLVVLGLLVLMGLAAAGGASALTNPERHYELVSPVYKGGFGVGGFLKLLVSQDGERVVFTSAGAFAGDPAGPDLSPDYLAQRGPDGWETVPVLPPTGLLPGLESFDFSPSLESTLREGKQGPNAFAAEANEEEGTEFWTHQIGTPDAVWTMAGTRIKPVVAGAVDVPEYLGADPAFCHIIFDSNIAATPEAEEEPTQLYEQSRGCGSEAPAQRLVSANDHAKLLSHCYPATVGDESAPNGSAFNAIADGGQAIFFTGCFTPSGGGETHQLFVRLGGSRTLELSKSIIEPEE